jgi:uncharacterized protein
MLSASYWVEKLNLLPHPEGGYFKQTYESNENIAAKNLPTRFGGDRSFSTAIYFLIEGNNFSAFHKIKSDEVWHFYYGQPLEVYYIDYLKELVIIKLGQNPENGEVMQAVVPAGSWFGSKMANNETYCLVGCTVSPGFNFADFQMADRAVLLAEYPRFESIIKQLTR